MLGFNPIKPAISLKAGGLNTWISQKLSDQIKYQDLRVIYELHISSKYKGKLKLSDGKRYIMWTAFKKIKTGVVMLKVDIGNIATFKEGQFSSSPKCISTL